MDQMQPEYRAATALSNIAVALHERGCYGQAHDTLLDAVQLMTVACRSEGVATSFAPLSRSNIDKKVQRGARRLASVAGLKSNTAPKLTISRLSPDADASTVIDMLSLCKPSSSHSVFFYFDDYELGERDPDVDSAIILLNLGQSSLRLSKAAKSVNAKHALLVNSLKVFDTCETILATRASTCGGDDVLLPKMTCVAAVLMAARVRALNMLRRRSEMTDYLSKLADLTSSLRENDVLRLMGQATRDAVAAAAA